MTDKQDITALAIESLLIAAGLTLIGWLGFEWIGPIPPWRRKQ